MSSKYGFLTPSQRTDLMSAKYRELDPVVSDVISDFVSTTRILITDDYRPQQSSAHEWSWVVNGQGEKYLQLSLKIVHTTAPVHYFMVVHYSTGTSARATEEELSNLQHFISVLIKSTNVSVSRKVVLSTSLKL